MDIPKLPLKAVYDRERNTPDSLYMIQRLADNSIKTYTWRESMDQARRMASYLLSLKLPPWSNIALIARSADDYMFFAK